MFSKLLVKSGLMQMSHEWLNRQFVRKDIGAIEFALENGLYDIREQAAHYLGELKSENSRFLLVQTIHDPVPAVSEAAVKALEEIGMGETINELIASKRSYWKQYKKEIVTENRSSESKYVPEPRDRPSRKSFENLKQMLRKPMNSGKWF